MVCCRWGCITTVWFCWLICRPGSPRIAPVRSEVSAVLPPLLLQALGWRRRRARCPSPPRPRRAASLVAAVPSRRPTQSCPGSWRRPSASEPPFGSENGPPQALLHVEVRYRLGGLRPDDLGRGCGVCGRCCRQGVAVGKEATRQTRNAAENCLVRAPSSGQHHRGVHQLLNHRAEEGVLSFHLSYLPVCVRRTVVHEDAV